MSYFCENCEQKLTLFCENRYSCFNKNCSMYNKLQNGVYDKYV
jgi:hypothetical protein